MDGWGGHYAWLRSVVPRIASVVDMNVILIGIWKELLVGSGAMAGLWEMYVRFSFVAMRWSGCEGKGWS